MADHTIKIPSKLFCSILVQELGSAYHQAPMLTHCPLIHRDMVCGFHGNDKQNMCVTWESAHNQRHPTQPLINFQVKVRAADGVIIQVDPTTAIASHEGKERKGHCSLIAPDLRGNRSFSHPIFSSRKQNSASSRVHDLAKNIERRLKNWRNSSLQLQALAKPKDPFQYLQPMPSKRTLWNNEPQGDGLGYIYLDSDLRKPIPFDLSVVCLISPLSFPHQLYQ